MNESFDPTDRVLVTGGSGFIGTNLVNVLKAAAPAGPQVLSIDIAAPQNPDNADVHKAADIRDERALALALREFRPTHIIHLAARTDLDGKALDDYSANTAGVESMIRAILGLDERPRSVLFASSRLVCEIGYTPAGEDDYCPTTAYGQSKVAGELLVRKLAGDRFRWTMFRPTSIWGPWFRIPYRNFFDAVRAGRYLHPKGLHVRKSFGYVHNSIYQIAAMATTSSGVLDGRTSYLCDYTPLDLEAWANLISASFHRGPVRSAPMFALRAVAGVGDAIEALTHHHVKPPLTSFRLDNLTSNMLHESWGLEQVAPRLPFELDAGVERTVSWMLGDRALPVS
jgi:nucleoside-diphosphate-sugar epimerase